MPAFNWQTFTVRIPVAAPVEKIYHSWATRQGMEHWFLRLSEYTKPDGSLRFDDELSEKGDTYRWLWHGWPDETTENGEILACNGKDYFRFSFGQAGVCTVKIIQEAGQNIVELVQSEIPDDDRGKQNWHLGCKTGWTFYLTNLKSILEGGIDLRNKDESLKNLVNS